MFPGRNLHVLSNSNCQYEIGCQALTFSLDQISCPQKAHCFSTPSITFLMMYLESEALDNPRGFL
jgi:hypothetical protein